MRGDFRALEAAFLAEGAEQRTSKGKSKGKSEGKGKSKRKKRIKVERRPGGVV